jgi:hypothetical protein
VALQLRTLQTMAEISIEKNCTIIFPAQFMTTFQDAVALMTKDGLQNRFRQRSGWRSDLIELVKNAEFLNKLAYAGCRVGNRGNAFYVASLFEDINLKGASARSPRHRL